jgi:hypothetical protein
MPVFPDTVVINRPWSDWIFLRQQRNTGGGGGFHIHNPWGNSDQWQGAADRNRLEVAYRTSGGQDRWGQLVMHGPSGNVGLGEVNPRARLHVNGNMIVTGDIALRSADVAERFSVEDARTAEPGTVMVLGHGGTLHQSEHAYDRKVAGVVCGAGSYSPGIVLDHDGEDRGQVGVALLGKVCCRVDAGPSPVEVGDLLATSEIPGHAMKATDPERAFGATLGKALEPLLDGKGLVPILVTLQ